MAQFTIDNIPKELLEQIRQRAQKERVSFEEAVVLLLHQALKTPPSFTKALHHFRQTFPEHDSEDAKAFETQQREE